MTTTLTPRKLSTREKEADVAARAIIGGRLFIAGDIASNSYWTAPAHRVAIVLERAGLELADGHYLIEGPGKVERVGTEAPNLAGIWTQAKQGPHVNLEPATIPGTESAMFGANNARIFVRSDGQYVALNADYLSFLIGDARPDDGTPKSSKNSHGRGTTYHMTQQEAKVAGPVIVTTITSYGAETEHLLMPVRIY